MAYLGKTPSQAVRSRYYFTASGGETSLSGADDNTNTLTFTDGNYVDVSLNGVALVAGTDYNTTTANTIGGLTALVASDVVEVIVYDTFSVFGGEFRGDISLGDNVKAKFGASDDLQIYHDASDSIINDNGTGSLKLQTGGSTKLEVTSTGIDVTGTVTADGLTVDNGSSGQSKITISEGGVDNRNLVLYSPATGGTNSKIAVEGTTANLDFVVNNGAQTAIRIGGSTGDISFYEDTGTTAKFFWDASAERLELSNLKLYSDNVRNESGILYIGTAGNHATQFYNNDANTVHISGTGNVGIGTSSPNSYSSQTTLTINGSTYGRLDLESAGTLRASLFATTGSTTLSAATDVLSFDTSGGEAMRIDSSGKVLINTTSTIYGEYLRVNSATSYTIHSSRNTTGTDGHVVFSNANGAVGSITTSGSSTAYVTSSDHRLKENVTDVTDGITRVKQLEPKRFNFIVDPDTTVDGFLAHEAQAVVPEAVTGTHNEVDADGNAVMQGIDQSKLVPLLTAALKEAITKIETLETEMTSVKARLDALEAN